VSRPPSPERHDRGHGPVRVVLFGSGSFALPLLDSLVALPGVDLVAVVSTPDRAAGRAAEPTPTPIAARARETAIPLFQPRSLRTAEAVEMLASLRPTVVVLADYGRIVPDALLDVPRSGFINLHPSLLPRHRGATPIPAAIAAGDPETGVTLFLMDAGMDTGPIVAKTRRRLDGSETAPMLEAALAADAATLLAATLPEWLAGALHAVPQPETGVTTTRPLRREDGRLDPSVGAVALERLVRAHLPWPASFVETPLGRLIVTRAAAGPAEATDAVATIVADGDGLALATADGRLRLLDVGLSGTRSMTAAELRRGRPALVGSAVAPPVGESPA
jgi:methionyl-tRNA formyltransferase